jgi:alanyl-tRNA synthetase
MKAEEMRRTFIEYFTSRGHKEIASASLFPENDPSVLFTTAGMQPLVPYLLGERHPLGGRLVGVQKCVRTDDIEEVGDKTHHTYFEMLGNWSLGDYFKQDSIEMSYDFLTNVVGIPADRLAVTVFEGNDNIPRDEEAYDCWKRAGLNGNQIFFYGHKENWWGPAGKTGPCGPDSEIFYDTLSPLCGETCGPACGCGKYMEIWNNVFMQYNKLPDGTLIELSRKNIDTGMSLERILAIMNHAQSNYETELFLPVISKLEDVSHVRCSPENVREFRIIADHMRAVTFILGDGKGVTPSNTEQGYIVRRLIRRVIRLLRKRLAVSRNVLADIAETVIAINASQYSELLTNRAFIYEQLEKEYTLFNKTLDSGLKSAEKILAELNTGETINGAAAFRLFDTFGFPLEFTEELAAEKGVPVDAEGFRKCLLAHQEKSRSSAGGMFKGGLADHSVQTVLLHTATHLLNGALHIVLGDTITQRGSNINQERLRFDFTFERKLTDEELRRVSDIVNEAIAGEIDVVCEEMTLEKAFSAGAVGVFEKKYVDSVRVYTIEGYSKEICGGPHAGNTRELKAFRILKEESASSGVRRIKAAIG